MIILLTFIYDNGIQNLKSEKLKEILEISDKFEISLITVPQVLAAPQVGSPIINPVN